MNIGVASGKGGTGKTTIASNLALAVEEPRPPGPPAPWWPPQGQ